MRKFKLKFNDRVQYALKNQDGSYSSKVGYVKQIRKGLFSTKYMICVAKSDVIHLVNECDVISLVDKKDNKVKSDENGNI